MKFFISLLILISSKQALAYPQFVGHGYTSCLTCHYNAAGNGPLNDYGRMLAATEIADRVFGPSTDEKLAEQSGVLGSTKMPTWWRPSASYRGLYMESSVWRNPQYRYIHMQADFTNAIRFDEDDKMVAVVNFGYAPTPRGASKTDKEANRNWTSREHYLRRQLSETTQVYGGFMDKAYGLRIPDHEAYSRRSTYNSQNDQVHGVMLNYNKLPFEATAHAFMGNLLQSSDTRHKGGSFILEYEPFEKARIGLTGQYLKSDYIQQIASAILGRFGVGKGSAVMFETGMVKLKPQTRPEQTGFYTLMQPYMRLSRGFYFFTTFEYFTANIIEDKTRNLRLGPGLQYYPAQRLELRLDVYNERTVDPETVRGDDWSVLSQVHVWL